VFDFSKIGGNIARSGRTVFFVGRRSCLNRLPEVPALVALLHFVRAASKQDVSTPV
jgi:hypothetical protein